MVRLGRWTVAAVVASVVAAPASSPAALPQQGGAVNLASPGAGAIRIQGPGGAWTGFSVAPAGDVNGDGNADLVIGAPHANANAGSAFVVFGPVQGTVNLGNLGARGFRIDGAAGAGSSDQLGYAVAGLGDINGDGRGEVIVGAPFTDAPATDAGSAVVVFGRSQTSAVNAGSLGSGGFAIRGPGADSGVGKSVAAVPDMNGDNRPEIAVGGPDFAAPAGSYSGAAWVVYDRSTGPVDLGSLGPSEGLLLRGPSTNAVAGMALAGVPDLNGDTRGEIAVGAPGAYGSDGAGFLAFGAAPGGGLDLLTAPGVIARRSGASEALGQSLAAVGDQNGDGLADLLIGSQGVATPNARAEAGIAYLAYGRASAGTLDPSSDGFAIKGATGERAGYAVAGLGDVDGAGGPDFAVGAPCAGRNALARSGSVFVLFRDPARTGADLASLPADQGFRIDGPQANASCEDVDKESDVSVASAGDANGDGRPDVLVGMRKADDAWIVLGWGATDFTFPASVSGTAGQPLSLGASAVRRTGGVSFSVDPALPDGLRLDPATGVIAGTPSAAAARRTYTVTMTDLAGTAQRPLSLEVAAAPVAPVEVVPPRIDPPAPDGDGDGIPDLADRCPTSKGSPGNVSGCINPFRRLGAKALMSVTPRGRIRSLRLVEISSPRATLRFTCVRCAGVSSFTQRPPLTAPRVAKALRRATTARLNARSRVILTLTEPGTIGWQGVFTKGPVLRSYCLPPGSSKPRPTCDATPGLPGLG